MRSMSLVIYTDGGSRGNPGPAGAGASIQKGGKEIAHVSKFLGKQTNNVAEYEALILALEEARRAYGAPVAQPVTVRMDSELIVKQMRGEYRVKDPTLQKQHQRVKLILTQSFSTVHFEHVRREYNTRADELANNAMDNPHGSLR